MNTIKYLKNNKIELNGTVYKPYTICSIPQNFGCITCHILYSKIVYLNRSLSLGRSRASALVSTGCQSNPLTLMTGKPSLPSPITSAAAAAT